jgi:hypothetical protein
MTMESWATTVGMRLYQGGAPPEEQQGDAPPDHDGEVKQEEDEEDEAPPDEQQEEAPPGWRPPGPRLPWPFVMIAWWPCNLSDLANEDGSLQGNQWFSQWKQEFNGIASINLRPLKYQKRTGEILKNAQLVIKAFDVYRPYQILLAATKRAGFETEDDDWCQPWIYTNDEFAGIGPADDQWNVNNVLVSSGQVLHQRVLMENVSALADHCESLMHPCTHCRRMHKC